MFRSKAEYAVLPHVFSMSRGSWLAGISG